MNYKIAIIGNKEMISGFSLLGVEIFPVESKTEAKDLLFNLKNQKQDENNENSPKKYAIIFVIEEFIKDLSIEDYQKLQSGALPAIIPLPSYQGSTGFGETKIRRIVEKAVGSDIFGNN
jgi:V/A-type H+-transporting ATPase subunit F